MLILSVSPENIKNPYYFEATHKNVYSLEELMYHCYYYWKQSINDFLSGKLEIWINKELNMSYISGKIQKIKEKEENITSKYLAFLKIIDYFDENELESLKKDIYSWEYMDKWKKEKELADEYVKNGNYAAAVKSYIKALEINDDFTLLNNLGVTYLKMGKYDDAMLCYRNAHRKEPKNEDIIINIAEVFMLEGKYKEALDYADKYEFMDKSPKKYNFLGMLENKRGNTDKALNYYQKAMEYGDKEESPFKIAQLYIKKGMYEEARQMLEKAENKESSAYYCECARLEQCFDNEKEAINYADKAVELDKNNKDAWLLLAKLYNKKRMVKETEMALFKVFELDSDNEEAKIEYANIRRKQGFVKECQNIFKGLLDKWKQLYREES